MPTPSSSQRGFSLGKSSSSSLTPFPKGSDRLPLLYEDASCLVINKPAGLAVHEAPGIRREHTVIGQLERVQSEKRKAKEEVQKTGSLDILYQSLYTPLLVHRLDQETSGCLIVAKNKQAQEYFERLFRDGKVDKEYVTLVKGAPRIRRGTIDRSLEGRQGQKVRAVTEFTVAKRYNVITLNGVIPPLQKGVSRTRDGGFPLVNAVSLARVRILTGRMHQIRKHFSSIGHPVVMDGLYGDFRFNKAFRKAVGLKRLFLHAASLSFIAPSGERVSVTAPLPLDLRDVLERLG